MNTKDILEKLVAFDTVSRNSNMALMHYIQHLLGEANIQTTLIPNAEGTKANLLATIGPTDSGGVMLSGHTDVVPVEGQVWSKPAFKLTCSDGKYFGRGTTDMKGFVACAIASALKAQRRPLKAPLHLAFSYDEEIGCQGVRSMIDLLQKAPLRPAMCIVGEPTSLAVATGHKGKIALKARCIGREGHSALAPLALNALHLGCDFIAALREIQNELMQNFAHDDDYDVPYTTLHVGKMNGGVALNIVPNLCTIDWEIRNLANDSTETILTRVKELVELKLQEYKSPKAEIFWRETFSYPGLGNDINSEIINFVRSLTGTNNTIKVAFGTEGGLFHKEVGIPTVVCGPGSMLQGHKPNEFITVEQMDRCDLMMTNLLTSLK